MESPEALISAINRYFQTGRCGCSIYDYAGKEAQGDRPVTLDRIVFDFDSAQSLDDARKMHAKFKDFRHFMVFSGGGFHFYMFAKNGERIMTQEAQIATLNHAYTAIEAELGVKNDASLTENALAHMLAIPGTWNSKPGRFKYVIFVNEQDLDLGLEHIQKKADHAPSELVVYGQELFDISQYARDARTRRAAPVALAPAADAPKDWDVWLRDQPIYIRKMLTDVAFCNRKSRFYVALYCVQKCGFDEGTAMSLAKHFYSRLPHDEGGTQWDRVQAKNSFADVYKDPGRYSFPSLATLQNKGYI